MEKITLATIYKAFDGKIFVSEAECKKYEKQKKEFLDNLKFFKVSHSPDLNETGLFTEELVLNIINKMKQTIVPYEGNEDKLGKTVKL